ncbi:MAG: hypothetical protein Q7S02_02885 [bacterium]|nr:hypothetical protein [bacterium]
MAKRSHHPGQFDLFPAPKREDENQPPEPPADVELVPPPAEESHYPTAADEQERAEMEHGPGVTYRQPKSRAERAAERRYIRQILDDALGRLGTSGRQLLTDAESPFVKGAREAVEARRRAEEERSKRNEGQS